MSKGSKKLVSLFLSVICMTGSECFADKGGNVYSPYMQLNGMKLFNVKEYNASIGVDTFFPLWQLNRTDLVFIDARLGDRSGSPFEANLHFGYRRLIDSIQKIYGIYGSFDRKKTGLSNYFNQVTLGTEYWNKNWFIGGNIYYPVGESAKNISDPIYELRKNRYEVYNVWLIAPSKEKALAGLDAEVGYEFTKGLVGYVGGYYFNAKEADVVYGPRARITYDWSLDSGNRIFGVFDKIGIEANIQRDAPRGVACYLSINARIGLSSTTSNVLQDVSRHMVDPVRRDVDIISSATHKTEQAFRGSNNEIIDIISRDNHLYAKSITDEDDLIQLRNFGFNVLKMPQEKSTPPINPGANNEEKNYIEISKLEEKQDGEIDTAKIRKSVNKSSKKPKPVAIKTQEPVQEPVEAKTSEPVVAKAQEAAQEPVVEGKTSEQPVVTKTQEAAQKPITEAKISAPDSAPVQAPAPITEAVQGNGTVIALSRCDEVRGIQENLDLATNSEKSKESLDPADSQAAVEATISNERLPLHKEENVFIKKIQEISNDLAKQKAEDKEIAYIENYYNKQPKPVDQEKLTRLRNREKIDTARTNVELLESTISLAAGINNVAVMTRVNGKSLKHFSSINNDLNNPISTKTEDKQDPYRILGVSPDAPLKEIEQKYKQEMRLVHPDRNGLGLNNINHINTVKYNEAIRVIRERIASKNNIEITMPATSVLPLIIDKPSSGQNFIVKADQMSVQQPLIKGNFIVKTSPIVMQQPSIRENFIIKTPYANIVLPSTTNKAPPKQNFIVKASQAVLGQPIKTNFIAKGSNLITSQLLAEQNLLVKRFQTNAAQSLIKKDFTVENSQIPVKQILIEQKLDPVDMSPREILEPQEPLGQNFIIKSSRVKKAGVVENSDSDGSTISTPQPDNLNGFTGEDSLSEIQSVKQRNMNAELRELANRECERQRFILSRYKEKYLSSTKPISEAEAAKYQEIYTQGSNRDGIIKVLENYLAPSFDLKYKRYKKEVKEVIGFSQEKSKIAVTNNDIFMLLIDRIPELNAKDPIVDKLRFLLDRKADGLL